MKMTKVEKNTDDDGEDWCFVCKDGGDMRICDHEQCLKSFHPICLKKDESFLDGDDRWTCDWHVCYKCQESSQVQCYTCTKAVCRSCLNNSDLLKVKGKYGFCEDCLELALLIEEGKDYTSDGNVVDLTDRNTHEGLFVEYYEIIKKDEGFESQDIHAALDKAKKKKKKKNNKKSESHSEAFSNEDGKQISDDDDDDVAHEKKGKRKCKEKKSEKKKAKKPKKSNHKSWWPTSRTNDVTSIVNENVNENKVMDDKVEHDSGNDNTNIASGSKWEKGVNVEEKQGVNVEEKHEKVDDDVAEYPFAAVVEENLQLVYLRKSLVCQLLKEPELFEEKVIGCFVRVKLDAYNRSTRGYCQLMQVKGVKAVQIAENKVEAVLLVSSEPKEIGISRLADVDFSKEECDLLKQQVLAGQLERPTVVDLQKKARLVHEDITKHKISSELVWLGRKIDQANEKGWRQELYEYRLRKKTLESPTEQSRLLANVPLVIPDTSEPESNIEDVNKVKKNDVPILQCDNTVQGTSEGKAHHGHASSQEDIPCKKGDENTSGAKCNTAHSSEKPDHDPRWEIWCILGPQGLKFKSTMSFMKKLSESPNASEFKVWKEDQKEEDAISLPEAINIAFPNE